MYFCLESQPVKLFTVSGTKLTAKPQQETKVFSHTACLCVCGALPKIRLHVSDALGHGGRHPNFSMLVMRALCSLMKPGLLPSCLLRSSYGLLGGGQLRVWSKTPNAGATHRSKTFKPEQSSDSPAFSCRIRTGHSHEDEGEKIRLKIK